MHTLDCVVTTTHPLTAEEIGQFEGFGLKVVGSVGSDGYRVRGATDATIEDLRSMSNVAGANHFDPEQKLDESLRRQTRDAVRGGAAAAGVAGAVTVLVSVDPATSEQTIPAIREIGDVIESSPRRAKVQVDPARIGELAALPGVVAAEREPDARTQNNIARGLIHANPLAATLGLDGSGEVVGVADSGLDTGVNDASMLADFSGRIVNIRATVNKAPFGVADGADLNNHGTHVSGSIAGDGSNSNGNLAGLAPAAQITMLSMGPNNSTGLAVPVDLITGVFQDAYGDGARLHNNSWGSQISLGNYTAFSEDVDLFVRDNPDMLIVIAAGNQGPGASTVTPPGTAKNCLTIGAAESVRPLPATITLNTNPQDHDFNPTTPPQNVPIAINNFDQQADNADDIATFSSRGPTSDGRIKPDLVAPGTFILSCRSQVSTADVGPDGLPAVPFYADDADGTATHAEAVGRGLPGGPFFGAWDQLTPDAPAGSGAAAQQNYFYDSGTSMAAPITTGAAALLRQYLRQQRGVTTPSAALMKALLVNSAALPAGASPAPDNQRGFGWLDIENTIAPSPTGRQAISDDVDLAIGPPAPTGTMEVRTFSVQLADSGHPFRATLAWTDAPAPANVGGLNNRLYLRVVDPNGTVFDGDVTPFPTVTNNVQRVHIDAPIAGVYTIEVYGVSVISGIAAHLPDIRQDFALAVINGIGFSPAPVDIVQVLDRSGSMGFYGYIGPVRERAKQMVDILRIHDRTAVVAFDTTATLIHGMEIIDGFAKKVAIRTSIDGIGVAGLTSIGGGLQLGANELATGGDASHPQALVLLSDGHENTPPWVGGAVTDSPPSWYGGPDFTEILPTLPPAVKVYTVSLGVQSDQVLLQDIATNTGGVFQAIHSSADVGKLHEIYVHLQALTGGEEVITAGSAAVDGLSIQRADVTSAGSLAGLGGVDGALRSELQNLVSVSSFPGEAQAFQQLRTLGVHAVPVDETLRSVVMMASWHRGEAPITLDLVTPSRQVLRAGTPLHVNARGSSYQYFRIEEPEPGLWFMVVRAGARTGGALRMSHGYTWGAYGRTPLAIRYELPRKRIGARALKLAVSLDRSDDHARTIRFSGKALIAQITTDQLLEKHARELERIRADVKLDRPGLDPNLAKLPLLDAQVRARGYGSIFQARTKRLVLTRTQSYTDAIPASTPGVHAVDISVNGRTPAGFAYRRQTRFDVRS
jgi:subtilisin family serine protease